MSNLLQDLRLALRTMRASPGFTGIAIVTLALGIGVNTTVFSCVNTLFLRPLPYADPERLVAVREDNASRGWRGDEVSYPNFVDWRGQSPGLADMAAHYGQSFNLAGASEPERVEGEVVSWNMFRLLGVRPMLGRDFTEAEGQPGAERVVLLSYALWQRRFGGETGVLGRVISLNGDPYVVIGVLPPPHQFPADQQLWVPITLDPSLHRGNQYLAVIGRLKPGVAPRQAEAELAPVSRRLAELYPQSNAGWSASVVPLRDQDFGQYKPVLAIMMAAVAFVLLIACANVANLMLARATARRREIAVRVALGAGRWRIVRQLLTESLLLALAGAALGLLVARWGLDLIVNAIPSDHPFWMVFTLDGRVLGFTLAVAVGTGIAFGLVPALRAARADLHESLKEGSRGSGSGSQRQRLRGALVVSEVALSAVLLIGAGLMVKSFLRTTRIDPGFDRQHLLTFGVALSGSPYDSAPRRTAFFAQLVPRLDALPGVSGAAASQAPPLSGNRTTASFTVEGQPTPVGQEPSAAWQTVTAGYVTLLGIPILRGRDLSEQDVRDTARVAVVSRTMGERFWPGMAAVGKRFRFGNDPANPWITVVGIAADVRQRRLIDEPESQFYLPYSRAPARGMFVLVRTAGDPRAAVGAVREAVRSVDAALPIYAPQTMDEMYRLATWESRLYGWMFGAFAAIAMALAAIGLYGVVAYTVGLRLHEIGVRMALGARGSHVLKLVVRRGLALAALGVAIGLAGAFGVTRVLQNLLYGVSPTDPTTFLGIPAMLAAVAFVASLVPALRATRVDPVVALRTE